MASSIGSARVLTRPTDADEAISALRANVGQVVMSIGTDQEDPILIVYHDVREDPDCRIVSSAVGGWSEGATEPVCAPESDFLREFLGGSYREDEPTLVLVEEPFKGASATGEPRPNQTEAPERAEVPEKEAVVD